MLKKTRQKIVRFHWAQMSLLDVRALAMNPSGLTDFKEAIFAQFVQNSNKALFGQCLIGMIRLHV